MILNSPDIQPPPRPGPTPPPVRVGYLLRMYPRFSQTFVVNEILELERQGLDLRIVSLRKPTDGIFHESVSRVRARAEYLPETVSEDIRRTLSLQWQRMRKMPRAYLRALKMVVSHAGPTWRDLVRAAFVLKWARRNKIDHLHVHFGTDEATVALLARMMGGPPYSMTLHAFDIFRQNVNRPMLATKINTSAFTVTVSDFNRRFLEREIPGLIADRIRVNYNGIDLACFSDLGGRRKHSVIFGVGRLVEKKGFQYLVKAVDILRSEGRHVRCLIAGEGPEQPALARMIARAGLEHAVQLLGPIKQHDVRRHLQTATCFALPCVEARDGNVDALPTVLLEALASGCPAVSTRLSGIPEIIEDGVSGLLAEPGNAESLACALRRILDDADIAGNLAARGQRRAEERFDIQKNVRVMHDWFIASVHSDPRARKARSGTIGFPATTAA